MSYECYLSYFKTVCVKVNDYVFLKIFWKYLIRVFLFLQRFCIILSIKKNKLRDLKSYFLFNVNYVLGIVVYGDEVKR